MSYIVIRYGNLTLLKQNKQVQNDENNKIGHVDFSVYSLGKKGDRRITIRGKRKKKERAYLEMKDLIDNGITSTTLLASTLGISTRQARRRMKNMALLGLVKLDKQTGRLVVPKKDIFYMSGDQFLQIPEIAKWINDCIARQVKPRTIRNYTSAVRFMFRAVHYTPKNVVSSKKTAIEFWTRFIVEYRKKYPSRGTHRFRIGLKNFLASFDIVFPARMGKIYGLSSAHDNPASYVGVCFSSSITEEIGKLILQDNDIALYIWWRIGLRTGARRMTIATMLWEMIYFDETNDDGTESFRLEQHETKDPRGQWFLGENGDWKTKYPPLDLKRILSEWKSRSSGSRFLWFNDSESD
ncbi:MAG: hypothetical protein ACREBJ_12330, partial [Nitrosotalea sp.]